MASLFTHPAWPVALYLAGKRAISKRLLWLSVVLTILPDADVIAFRFGIPYESQWGHRGFTHSILFAFLIALICLCFSGQLGSSKKQVFFWTFTSTLSHSILDAFTNGGLGVAWLWPVTNERYFFPFRPVQVSPIGALGFFSWRGLVVLISEFFWIWLPLLFLSFSLYHFRVKKAGRI